MSAQYWRFGYGAGMLWIAHLLRAGGRGRTRRLSFILRPGNARRELPGELRSVRDDLYGTPRLHFGLGTALRVRPRLFRRCKRYG